MPDKSKALTWTELRVGVVVIVSLALLAFAVLYVGGGGGSPFARHYALKALMADVNGLKAGAPVRVGGVEVGNVTRVDFARKERGFVEVTMRLDRRVRDQITTESQAQLGSLGLLGEKAVDITPSDKGIPIDDGGLIPAATQDPFKGLLTDASESTAHLRRILSRMDAGEGLIGKALRDDELYQRMLDVSVRLQNVLERLESEKGPLGRMVNDEAMSNRLAGAVESLETVATRIEEGKGTLGALSADDALARDLKALSSSLSEVAGRLSKGEGTAGRLLQDDALFRRVTDVTGRLDAVLVRLEAGEGSAGRLLQDPELYTELVGAARDVRELVSDIRKDPQKYLRVKLSLF
jgi:phospholipid/cholesterol/gamma-HCH transport system substrate-binding protein